MNHRSWQEGVSLPVIALGTAFTFAGCFASPATQSSGKATEPSNSTAIAEVARAAGPSPTPTIPAPGGRLGELDELFVKGYRTRQAAVREGSAPVITVSGSSLILFREGKETSERVLLDEYHVPKAVAHTPFSIYLRLSPAANGAEIESTLLDDLRELSRRIDASRSDLAARKLSEKQLKRQILILDTSKDFLTKVLGDRRVSSSDLKRLASSLGSYMLENTWDAGCAQIQATHKQVMQWKAAMRKEEWERIRVVNRGAHQARYKNAATQYFAWLLGDAGSSWSYPGESMRVVYAETVFGDQKSRDVLAGIVIDADASAAFFGDPWRLSEDVLRDGAAACVAQLPPGDRIWAAPMNN